MADRSNRRSFGRLHPRLVCAVVLSPACDELRVFALNRHGSEELQLELHVAALTLLPEPADAQVGSSVRQWLRLQLRDARGGAAACNSEEEPDRVTPEDATGSGGAVVDAATGVLRATLPPASWNLLRVGARGAS